MFFESGYIAIVRKHKLQLLHAAGLALLCSTAPLSHAYALELFGRCILGKCTSDEEKDNADLIDPKRYDVNFSVVNDEDVVGDAIKSASQLWQGKDRAVGGSAGVIARAKGDYRRILASLYNEGRYGGTISIKINGTEAASVPVGTEFNSGDTIVVEVNPGPVYLFGNAQVEGAPPAPTMRGDELPSLEDVGFSAGAEAKAGSVGKASKLLKDKWRQQGYATAKVTDRAVTANHPTQELNVVLTVESGPPAVYGDVDVQGTDRMDPAFVARQTGLVAGNEFDPDDLVKAKKRLDRLGVFSTQKIEEGKAVSEDGTLPIGLIVKERKLRRIGLGATVSSLDGVGLESYWLHRNLFGKAERLRLDAKVGGLGSTFDYQKFDYELGAAFTKPGVFTPDTDLNFNLYARREYNDSFIETSAGSNIGLTHYYSDALIFNGGVFVEAAKFESKLGDRDFITAGLDFSAVYDSRDSKLDASEGFYLSGAVKPFYEFNYQNFGAAVKAEARSYLSFGEDDRIVLAGRALAASIVGPDRSETPDNFLYFAGGGGSVRGYNFNGIGVEDTSGDITGGKSKLEASAELRFKAWGNFGGAVFIDAGSVSADTLPSFDQDVRLGAGFGVRYFTGLGPIRVDFAMPLNRRDRDPHYGIYAGIGQAF